MRHAFLGWQCRIRQLAIRQAGGRPSPGMQPVVHLAGRPLGRIVVLTPKLAPETYTAEFRHMVRRTNDPADRYASALAFLSAAYYQRPDEFSDRLAALFGPGSADARALEHAGRCLLEFEQYAQRFELPCAVRALGPHEPAYQATYWHNCLFNPDMPGDITILEFQPDWQAARAEPAPR